MKDHSTKMSAGRLRSQAGSDATAGNAVRTKPASQSGNKLTAVSKQSKRFKQTRTRSG